jgi:hypothetical protein
LREVAIFTERKGEDEAGRGKDIKTKIKKEKKGEEQGSKRKAENILRQSEGERER